MPVRISHTYQHCTYIMHTLNFQFDRADIDRNFNNINMKFSTYQYIWAQLKQYYLWR
jgi:hypothetical protein